MEKQHQTWLYYNTNFDTPQGFSKGIKGEKLCQFLSSGMCLAPKL